jgi:hypothetical protein
MVQSYLPPTAINGGLTEVSKPRQLRRSRQSQAITREDDTGTMEIVMGMVVGKGQWRRRQI